MGSLWAENCPYTEWNYTVQVQYEKSPLGLSEKHTNHEMMQTYKSGLFKMNESSRTGESANGLRFWPPVNR